MSAPTSRPTTAPAGDVEIALSPEAAAQAGIQTAAVTVVAPSTSVQVPGTIMANAYREVKVFPIVGASSPRWVWSWGRRSSVGPLWRRS
jgi:hypothetical protein